MGALSGLKKATRGYVSNYLQPGSYIVRLDASQLFDSESKGEMWKNTLTVLAVEEGEHKVGEEVHHFISMTKGDGAKKMFQQKLKAFIAGVLDCEDEDVDEAAAEKVCGDEQVMAGMVFRVQARNQASRKSKDEDGNPKVFTNYSWFPQMSPAEITEAIGEEAVAEFFPNGLDD